ncbi:hypothetical protein KAR91_87545 [Candidatus Pacearchaeota archaeon]|nr:hypothetical protein [Candidatus Pacearchaeota archaeon]
MKYLSLLFLIGCIQNDFEYFDSGLEQYYRTFQIEAERLGVNLPSKSIVLTWKELEGDRAHCHTGKTSIKVCVNNNFFNPESEYNLKLEATIFHELGHGLLNRSHIDPINGIETSLMSVPGMHEDWINGSKREYYLKELFGIR